MDYPAPMVQVSPSGELLETASYAQHIGEFDKVMIECKSPRYPAIWVALFSRCQRYMLLTDGYTQLSGPAAESPTAARDFLQRLIADAETTRGYVFLSDQDNGGRSGPDSSGGIHGLDYRSSQWDNGMDPATALEHALDVRRRALDTLDESALQPFQPYSRLRDLLPPVYLWHRYEVK